MTTSNHDRPNTPFAGLAEAAAQWLPEPVAQSWSEACKESAKAPAPDAAFAPGFAPGLAKDAWDYWVDAAQRTVLFWDVLRKRGNQAIEHHKAGHPPVLAFAYAMVVDGRKLARPVNYALVRIEPEAGQTSTRGSDRSWWSTRAPATAPASAASRRRARSASRFAPVTRSIS